MKSIPSSLSILESLERMPLELMGVRSIGALSMFYNGFSKALLPVQEVYDYFSTTLSEFSRAMGKRYGSHDNLWTIYYKLCDSDEAAFLQLIADFKIWYSETGRSSEPVNVELPVPDHRCGIKGIIESIQYRPTMWFVNPTITNLAAFFSGFSMADEYLRGPGEGPPGKAFEKWVVEQAGWNGKWDRVIRYEVGMDEKVAFFEFFKRYEEFSKECAPT
jgi:hypothetical protein